MTPIVYEKLINELPTKMNGQTITIKQASEHIFSQLILPIPEDGSRHYKTKAINWMSQKLGQWVVLSAVNYMVTIAIESAGQALHLSDSQLDFNQDTLVELDFNKAGDSISKVIFLALSQKVEQLMDGFKDYVLLIGLACLLGLLLDPLAHFIWKRQKSKKESEINLQE